MPQVLILGSGLVAGPLVEYLHNQKFSITLASQFIEEADALAKGRDNIFTKTLNVSDEEALGAEIENHQIVVSFIPFQLHLLVAKQCIKYAKHLVTASYLSPEMEALNEEAKANNITLLNEMGFDPGIDHLSAMSIINQVHDRGGKIDSFISWGAGLPSTEDNDNPFGYKFAWAPKGVLLAMVNNARYLKNGEVVDRPSNDLLKQPLLAWTGETESFSGYPNRDSSPYKEAYGLHDIKDLLRGTLRYSGNLEIMQDAKELGLLNDDQSFSFEGDWRSLMAHLVHIEASQIDTSMPISKQSYEAFKWLGLFDSELIVSTTGSLMDAFCEMLKDKLVFKNGEKDMAFLLHKFAVSYPDGTQENRMSKFLLYGDGEGNGYSAMAKAVGTPAAIATQLLLEGKLTKRGAIRPTAREYYTHLLPLLKQQGLECEESVNTMNREEFFKELY